MNEETALMPKMEIISSEPKHKLQRDRAITAVCGEVLASLEQRKAAITEELAAAEKSMGQAGKQKDALEKSEVLPTVRALLQPKLTAIKRALEAFPGIKKASTELTSLGVSLQDVPEDSVRVFFALQVGKARGGYGNEMTFSAEDDNKACVVVKAPKFHAVCDKIDELDKQRMKLLEEQVRVNTELVRMPAHKMLIEAAVAKRDMESDPEDNAVLVQIRAAFHKMASKNLQKLLQG